MKIIKSNRLSNEEIIKIENFIHSNRFNQGISFSENDMNYYEDFPCFFMLYENDTLMAFMSIFIPDGTSCEIYLNISDQLADYFTDVFNKMYNTVKPILQEYQLYKQYILFDHTTCANIDVSNLNLQFSYSECLMRYELTHNFIIQNKALECSVEHCDESIKISTYANNTLIGTCFIEASNNYALIHDVEVKNKYRGFGYGTETLYHTVNYLKDNGYTQILLHVNSANTIAFTMYSHHGFNVIEQIDYYKIIQLSNQI